MSDFSVTVEDKQVLVKASKNMIAEVKGIPFPGFKSKFDCILEYTLTSGENTRSIMDQKGYHFCFDQNIIQRFWV